jgi:type IV pilus assembly protein PilA
MIPRTLVIAAGVTVLALSACGAGASRQNALELTAIVDIRSLLTAQVQYQSQFGRFAANLSELGTAKLIPSSLASGEKDGFKFTMTASPNGFAINASPKVYGETGRRNFYSDQTMVIRENRANEPANSSSPELK